jgi:hypothetical protein
LFVCGWCSYNGWGRVESKRNGEKYRSEYTRLHDYL